MVSYLDISINIKESKYETAVYDKRDDFNFNIVNFPFLDSNIPVKPAYGVYISQLVRVCDKYDTFAERNWLITSKLIKQGFHFTTLCACFKKFSRRHKSIFDKYGICVKQHILDGVCRPLLQLRSLSRRVTTRGPKQ